MMGKADALLVQFTSTFLDIFSFAGGKRVKKIVEITITVVMPLKLNRVSGQVVVGNTGLNFELVIRQIIG